MKIQSFFKEAFYINLDHRTDRRESFEGELSKYGLNDFVKRYSACTPRIDDFDNSDIVKLSYRRHGACGRSHKNIVQYAKDKNLDNILIFEDDAVFYDGGDSEAMEIIEKAIDSLSNISDWDVFYMGGIIKDEKVYKPVNNLLKVDIILTTHAWAINKSGYDGVLRYIPGDGYSGDHYDSPIDASVLSNKDLNKYLAYPLAVYQREGVLSDCGLGGQKFLTTGDVKPWIENYETSVAK